MAKQKVVVFEGIVNIYFGTPHKHSGMYSVK